MSVPAEKKAVVDSGLTTLSDVIAYLISYRIKDYYARVISALPCREDPRIPMMGVMFERGHHILLYNQEWVDKKLTEGRRGFNEIRATIAHEAMHVILCHIARQMKIYRNVVTKEEQARFGKLTNIATDMACNDLLSRERDEQRGGPAYPDMTEHANMWVLPQSRNLPPEMTYEWYLSLLMDPNAPEGKGKIKVKLPGGGSGQGGSPGEGEDPNQPGHTGAHEHWLTMMEDMTDEEIEVMVSQVEGDAYEKVKSATEAHKKGRGTVPGFIEETLDNMLKPPLIPWKKLLHQFVSRCRLSKPLRSMERPRRRWLNLGTTLYPGLKRDRTFKLGFFVDTSGSMSEADLMEGMAELQGIQRVDKDVEINVVQFDTQIHHEYKLTANAPIDLRMHGRGGTDFNMAFERAQEFAKKGEIDAMIIYTDGYAPGPELKYHPRDIPVLWCLTEGGQHPSPGYGFEIRRPRNRY